MNLLYYNGFAVASEQILLVFRLSHPALVFFGLAAAVLVELSEFLALGSFRFIVFPIGQTQPEAAFRVDAEIGIAGGKVLAQDVGCGQAHRALHNVLFSVLNRRVKSGDKYWGHMFKVTNVCAAL